MKICFDLDGTLCATPPEKEYADAIPYNKVIDRVNRHYDDGDEISIFTARGSTSKIDYHDLNVAQLARWGVKYHHLIDKNKPSYDLFIDDKAMNAAAWRAKESLQIVGLVASAFDLLHPGHCLILEEAKSICDHVIAALHYDPSVERIGKKIPIQSMDERIIQLRGCKYVDEIIPYRTEIDLVKICQLKLPDIRVLGSDAKGKPITGKEYCKNIYYHKRNYEYSSSELRKRIYENHREDD